MGILSGTPGKLDNAGVLVTSSIGTEIALGLIPGYETVGNYGRNPSVSTSTDPEDVWESGGLYPGFDATDNENISVASSSTSDAGTLVCSGTLTSGSSTTLVDSGADFVSDGVQVGMVAINHVITE